MKIIMYHYVRPVDPEMPYFKHLTPEQFSAQLDYFEQTEGFLSRDAFIASVVEKKPRKGVVLTFDDGLRDHYDYVFPELQRRGLWGIFYTRTWNNEYMLLPHRIHRLIGRFGGTRVRRVVESQVQDFMLTHQWRSGFAVEPYKRQDADADTKWVKRTFNFAMDRQGAEWIIGIAEAVLNMKGDSHWYLDAERCFEMHRCGNVIGGHSVTHRPMITLSSNELMREMWSPAFKGQFRTFAYPYGGPHTYDVETSDDCLRSLGTFCAMDVDPRDVNEFDLLNPFYLPRYDCNLFPPVRTA